MGSVQITRTEMTGAELRAAAVKLSDAAAARRALSLALVLEGADRDSAARFGGMDRQTLRDWVHRYNALGLSGLSNRKPPGASSRLTAGQKAEVKALVEKGCDPAVDGVVRWRCVDLSAVIKQRFGVTLGERAVGVLLHKLGMARLSTRPVHPQADLETQEAFKKTSPTKPELHSPITPVPSRSKFGSRTRRALASRAA